MSATLPRSAISALFMDMNDTEIFGKINACTYLYFRELSAPKEHSLRIVIDEASPGPFTKVNIGNVILDEVREIKTSSDNFSFEILWPFYVTYSITTESYACPDESAQGEGKLFCVYSKSHFLDYAQISTIPLAPVRHWAIYSLNHTVDVIAHEPPVLRILTP